MRISRPHGIDRETAEQLLDGAAGLGAGGLPAPVLAKLPSSVLASLPPAIRAGLPASLQARLPPG